MGDLPGEPVHPCVRKQTFHRAFRLHPSQGSIGRRVVSCVSVVFCVCVCVCVCACVCVCVISGPRGPP
jgi:hypothetical protein